MVFNATCNNISVISWRLVLLVEETGVHGENHIQTNIKCTLLHFRRYPIGVISVLDMAGFENFPINSFEQLCINVANEQLQNYFNEAVFGWEMKSYETEGIKPPKIKFINNGEILDLFLQVRNI
jgi:myosin-3